MKFELGGKPLVIGHRGAPLRAPENSLASFEAAFDCGADAIELDVSAGLAVSHSRRPRGETLALEKALELVRARDARVLVDLKCPGVERAVAAEVRRHGLLDRAFVSSTSPVALRRLAAAEPALTRSISYPNDRFRVSRFAWPAPVGEASSAAARAAMPLRVPLLLAAARASVITLHHRLVTPAVVEAARRRGVPVVTWTVNEPAGIERVCRAGVAGVITDDPEMARATVDRLTLS